MVSPGGVGTDSDPSGSSSFSQGFLREITVLWLFSPSRTVAGISLMPGTDSPLVIRSTMWAKELGYGAGGSVAEAGMLEVGSRVGVRFGAAVSLLVWLLGT